jgi:hypothetical protein
VGRSSREAKERLLAIRIPQSLLDSIDGHVARVRTEVPWAQLTRSDVVRWMISASIERYRVDQDSFRREVRDRPRDISEAS